MDRGLGKVDKGQRGNGWQGGGGGVRREKRRSDRGATVNSACQYVHTGANANVEKSTHVCLDCEMVCAMEANLSAAGASAWALLVVAVVERWPLHLH